MTRTLALVVAFLLSGFVVEAQPESPVAPNSWRPEVVSAPGVDAKGDLNLSIPILSVPGRGGMSYPIVFSYSSSVLASAQGSYTSNWLPTGWRFNPGSITREVFGGEVYDPSGSPASTDWTVSYVDFADETVEFQPDRYSITLPSGSAAMSPAGTLLNRVGWKVVAMMDQDPNGNPQPVDFDSGVFGDTPTGQYPQNGNIATTPRGDYTGFVVLTPDGTRHVFERPLIGTIEVTRGLYTWEPDGMGGWEWKQALFGDETERQFYVRSWDLSYILGPNYIGEDAPHAGDATGEWIILETRSYNGPRDREGWPGTHPLSLNESSRLQRVITPTHCALIFPGASLGAPAQSATSRISSIQLIRRSDASYFDEQQTGSPCVGDLVREVSFANSTITSVASDGVTSEVLHRFTYTPGNSTSNTIDELGYRSNGGGRLETWTTSTGGTITVEYEADVVKANHEVYAIPAYDIPMDPTGMIIDINEQLSSYSPNSTGTPRTMFGRRVASISVDDGSGRKTITDYSYGSGTLSAIPAHAVKGSVPDAYISSRRNDLINMATNRAQADVYYSWIKEEMRGEVSGTTENDVGSKTTTYSQGVPPRTMLWTTPHGSIIVQTNGVGDWGRPLQVMYEDESGCVVRKVTLGQDGSTTLNGNVVWPFSQDIQNHAIATLFLREEGRSGVGSRRVVDYAPSDPSDPSTCISISP
ncbi:MAG: hypothetical protein AAGI52_17340 [Bacteroidota bacterium]